MQVKLLRLLETGTFRPVGSGEVKTSNFRLICATHKNLLAMVNEGGFRNDLFYRINVFPIAIPSLADRLDDLPALSKAILSRFAGGDKYHLTSSAIRTLAAYRFRGNIRELRNLLYRAIVLADTNVIDSRVIETCFEEDNQRLTGNDTPVEAPHEGLLDELISSQQGGEWPSLKDLERRYIEAILAAQDGNKAAAAEALGVSERSLYRKLKGK